MSQLLSELKIGPNDWDALIVGDGSGTGWEKAAGWGAVLIDHYGSYRKIFHGAWSNGTSHIAELSPYIEVLSWYAAGPGKLCRGDAKKDGDPNAVARVHIVCDNSNIVNQGNRSCERNVYPWLWDAISGIERQGFLLKWHWIGRSRLALNRLVDLLSRVARVQSEAVLDVCNETLLSETGQVLDDLLYEFNPDDPSE